MISGRCGAPSSSRRHTFSPKLSINIPLEAMMSANVEAIDNPENRANTLPWTSAVCPVRLATVCADQKREPSRCGWWTRPGRIRSDGTCGTHTGVTVRSRGERAPSVGYVLPPFDVVTGGCRGIEAGAGTQQAGNLELNTCRVPTRTTGRARGLSANRWCADPREHAPTRTGNTYTGACSGSRPVA